MILLVQRHLAADLAGKEKTTTRGRFRTPDRIRHPSGSTMEPEAHTIVLYARGSRVSRPPGDTGHPGCLSLAVDTVHS